MRAALVVAALATAGTARADAIGVVATGEASLQPQLAAGVETWLRDHGRTVLPSPLEPDAISKLLDCVVIEDLGCARGVVEDRSKAPVVVYVRVDVTARSDGKRDLALVGYWFRKGREQAAERRTCSSCTEEGMRETLATLLVALADTPPPPPPAPAASVPVPVAAVPPEETPRTRLVPLALIGAGAAAVIAGGVLIAIDQDPPPKAGEQPPTYRDTATGGTVLVIAGLAAAGAGAYLWLHGGARSAPVAAVAPGGGYVGWMGRF